MEKNNFNNAPFLEDEDDKRDQIINKKSTKGKR